MKSLQSQIITLLRYPLAVLVLYIHCPFAREIEYPCSFFFREGLVFALCKCAVPLFFIFSGYLFFLDKDFNEKYYLTQIKKKFKTLFIPYIIWNSITIAVFSCIYKVTRDSFNICGIKDLLDFFYLYWGTFLIEGQGWINYDYPYDGPLWFIRDLMVLFLLSPIIYFMIKKLGGGIIVLLGLLFVSNVFVGFVGLRVDALFFFSVGSFAAIKKTEPISIVTKIKPIWFLSVYIVSLFFTFYFYKIPDVMKVFLNVAIITGCAIILIVSNVIVRSRNERIVFIRNRINSLAVYSFLIYASHIIPMRCMSFVLDYVFGGVEGNTQNLFCDIVYTSLVLCVLTYVFSKLRHFFPNFTSLLSGGRI